MILLIIYRNINIKIYLFQWRWWHLRDWSRYLILLKHIKTNRKIHIFHISNLYGNTGFIAEFISGSRPYPSFCSRLLYSHTLFKAFLPLPLFKLEVLRFFLEANLNTKPSSCNLWNQSKLTRTSLSWYIVLIKPETWWINR